MNALRYLVKCKWGYLCKAANTYSDMDEEGREFLDESEAEQVAAGLPSGEIVEVEYADPEDEDELGDEDEYDELRAAAEPIQYDDEQLDALRALRNARKDLKRTYNNTFAGGSNL
jgi:hypothetical protein